MASKWARMKQGKIRDKRVAWIARYANAGIARRRHPKISLVPTMYPGRAWHRYSHFLSRLYGEGTLNMINANITCKILRTARRIAIAKRRNYKRGYYRHLFKR
jgi:hypothetical protein